MDSSKQQMGFQIILSFRVAVGHDWQGKTREQYRERLLSFNDKLVLFLSHIPCLSFIRSFIHIHIVRHEEHTAIGGWGKKIIFLKKKKGGRGRGLGRTEKQGSKMINLGERGGNGN